MDFENQPLHRQIYARQILAKAGVSADARLFAAFAKVPREQFVGPPPWVYNDFRNYRELASTDPLVLYQDLLVGLDTGRGVNNGMPAPFTRSASAKERPSLISAPGLDITQPSSPSWWGRRAG